MSTMMDAAPSGPRDGLRRALLALLCVQLVALGGTFPYYAFARQEAAGLKVFATALAVLAVAAVVGTWRRAAWALWAVVVVTSAKIVVDVFQYSLAADVPELPVAALVAAATVLNGAVLVLAFQRARPFGDHVTLGQRAFFVAVLALAAWVAARGLFAPAHLAMTIPFNVPPLHSRFLGAMYLSGATFMVLAIRATAWRAVRIVVPMVAIWTGMLGLVSLRYLDAFDWSRPPTWTWFLAYSVFPIVAAWIAWRQRDEGADAALPLPLPLPRPLRAFLWVHGIGVTILALALLAFPSTVAAVWPWKITTQLAQVYSAPFLSYGIGALLAVRADDAVAARTPLIGTMVFAAAVLGASTWHRALFAPAALATWIWFGGFALAVAVLLRYGVAPVSAVPPATSLETS